LKPPVETEVKVRVADAGAARTRVEGIGARCVWPRHHEWNVLFDFGDARLRESGTVARVRSTERGGVFTYKGPKAVSGGVRTREEIETVVEDADALEMILARLGLRPVFRYEKYRETWRWREVEIVADETPIGVFLEIEGCVEGIHEAMSAMGFSDEEIIPDTYIGLFAASGGTGDMLF
jgi:adenylate cyclase, class 2